MKPRKPLKRKTPLKRTGFTFKLPDGYFIKSNFKDETPILNLGKVTVKFFKPRKKLKPVSTKRQKELKIYSKLRKAYLEEHQECGVCGRSGSLEIHHKQGREKDRLNDAEFWLAVHRKCHIWIHSNPKESYELGYSLKDSK